MKIRQNYLYGEQVICIRFTYDEMGSIVKATKIDDEETEFEEDEFAVPNVRVTREYFEGVLNNKRLIGGKTNGN